MEREGRREKEGPIGELNERGGGLVCSRAGLYHRQQICKESAHLLDICATLIYSSHCLNITVKSKREKY